MKGLIKDGQVRRRIPVGCGLPARFDDFVRAEPPYAVEWNNLDAYGLKRSARKEVTPFLRLSDGGLVAFWYHVATPTIVHIGAHGELQVIAHDFDDFLKAISARCSGLPDFDEIDQVFRVPGVKGKPKKSGIPALQQKFEQWYTKHTSLQEPLTTSDAETLRQRIYQIAKEMIRNGCSKVEKVSSNWWSMDFQIERTDANLSIKYLDYGNWCPVPKKYKLVPAVTTLLKLAKHSKRRRYKLSAFSVGIVSIDGDRELVLVPSETIENKSFLSKQ